MEVSSFVGSSKLWLRFIFKASGIDLHHFVKSWSILKADSGPIKYRSKLSDKSLLSSG